MDSIYYFAAWTDSGCLLGCSHKHETVSEATGCVSCAGGYIVAVENSLLRALNDEEEAEFQRAFRALPRPEPAVLQYEACGYGVMVRVKFVDGWGWDTWIRYDTHEEAVAHAWEGSKVVPFGTAEWSALSRSREPALPAPASLPQDTQPPRFERETLVEFVSRFVPSPIDAHDLTDKESAVPVMTEPVRTAETKSETLVDLVVEWINRWEMTVLERIYSLQVPARIEALRRQVRKTLKHESRTR